MSFVNWSWKHIHFIFDTWFHMYITVVTAHLHEHPTHRKSLPFELHAYIFIYMYVYVCKKPLVNYFLGGVGEGSGGAINVPCVQI